MSASEYHINITDGEKSAAGLLAKKSGLSITAVKQAMQKGAVWLTSDRGTNRLRRAKKALSAGNQLHFYFNPDILQTQMPEPINVADEGDYSVWIKPRSVFSQGSKWGDHCTITRWIETHDKQQRPAFIIHRLDKAATGLMLIGHARKTTNLFAIMFAKRQIHKTYQAIVTGHFVESGETVSFNDDIDGKTALTQARLIEYDQGNNRSLLEVTIETGRKHQIRKHLSKAGHAIVGDRLYGGGDDLDLQLAAVSLGFQCPLSDLQKAYELPDDFRPALSQ